MRLRECRPSGRSGRRRVRRRSRSRLDEPNANARKADGGRGNEQRHERIRAENARRIAAAKGAAPDVDAPFAAEVAIRRLAPAPSFGQLTQRPHR